jgi:hypothetical protein
MRRAEEARSINFWDRKNSLIILVFGLRLGAISSQCSSDFGSTSPEYEGSLDTRLRRTGARTECGGQAKAVGIRLHTDEFAQTYEDLVSFGCDTFGLFPEIHRPVNGLDRAPDEGDLSVHSLPQEEESVYVADVFFCFSCTESAVKIGPLIECPIPFVDL